MRPHDRTPSILSRSRIPAALLLALLVVWALVLAPFSATAGRAAAEDCSYGAGGPYEKSICWLDFSSFDFTAASSPAGQPMTMDLGDGLLLSFTATVTPGADGMRTIQPHAFPTFSQATIGNRGYYMGVTGQPALYQTAGDQGGWQDVVALEDIVLTRNGVPVSAGWSMLVADAESSNAGEGFEWSSSAPIDLLASVVPPHYAEPCTQQAPAWGASSVTCISGPASAGVIGTALARTEAPTSFSASFLNETGTTVTRQAVAFAVVFTTVSGTIDVANPASGADGEFTLTSSTSGAPIASATAGGAGGSSGSTGSSPIISGGTAVVDYAITPATGTPLGAYDIAWTCELDGQPVPASAISPDPSTNAAAISISVPLSSAVECSAVLTPAPPTTGDASASIHPGETATLNPETVPGKGAIESASFDDGATIKTVPGEGVWTIDLVAGQPVATFTPEDGYDGPVTPQSYTVVDEFGLSAQGTLSIDIAPATTDGGGETPPTTGAGTTTPPTSVAPAAPAASADGHGTTLALTGSDFAGATVGVVGATMLLLGALAAMRRRTRGPADS